MTAPENGNDGPRLRMSTVVGGVGLLAILDIILLITLGSSRSVWWPVVIVLADLAAGWLLVVLTGRQAAGRFRELRDALTGAPKRAGSTGASGRPGWTFLAALLVFLPGLLTDVAGLILLLPPVQQALGRRLGFRASGVMVRSTGFPPGAGFPPGFDPRSAGGRGPGANGPGASSPDGASGPGAPGGTPGRPSGGAGSGPRRGGRPEDVIVEAEGVDAPSARDGETGRRGTGRTGTGRTGTGRTDAGGDADDPDGTTKPPPSRS